MNRSKPKTTEIKDRNAICRSSSLIFHKKSSCPRLPKSQPPIFPRVFRASASKITKIQGGFMRIQNITKIGDNPTYNRESLIRAENLTQMTEKHKRTEKDRT